MTSHKVIAESLGSPVRLSISYASVKLSTVAAVPVRLLPMVALEAESWLCTLMDTINLSWPYGE